MLKRAPLLKTVLILLFICSLCSCKQSALQDLENIDLSQSIYWAPFDCETEHNVLEKADWEKLPRMGNRNLSDLVGKNGAFLWLKADFELPVLLRDEDLGLYIDFLRFADKVWVNGVYCGSYGEFPPLERSSKYVTHFYLIPQAAVSKFGKNTMLIKVWVHGNSEIGGKVYIGKSTPVKNAAQVQTFFHSGLYIAFEGGMFCATMLFLIMFLLHKKRRNYIYFVLLNVSTLVLHVFFFSPEIPLGIFTQMPYFRHLQLFLCLPILLIFYFITPFGLSFINSRQSRKIKIYRYVIFTACLMHLLSFTDFTGLYNQFPLFLLLCALQVVPLCIRVFHRIIRKHETHNPIVFLLILSPLFVGLIADLSLRRIAPDVNMPFVTLFTWQLSIIGFVLTLAKRFVKTAKENEYLNANLQEEVDAQTRELSSVNQRLELQLERDQMDLHTAELIQKKYFAPPVHKFKGWDIASCYEPAAQVSGDLFDYYGFADMLDGFSIFDVSGHGIGAGLVTMLSKDIIYQVYKDGLYHSYFTSKIMTEINRKFLNVKGNIDNYLTGLLFNFGNFDANDACKVQMTNAGHPHPFLWNAEDKTITELNYAQDEVQYGAIGIQNIDVSFNDINFVMKRNDILVCYTDGLTEAVNMEGTQFGKERVMNLIKENAEKPSSEILEVIKKEIQTYTEGRVQDDDLTILVLKRDDSTAPMTFEEELSADDF